MKALAATAAIAAVLAPGGSNYSWYQVDRPQPGTCVREPYGVIPNFDAPPAQAQIRSELAQMVRSGQRRLRIGIFHGRGFNTGTVMDSTGGDLSLQNRANLAGLLAAIKAAGFLEVEVAFHPEGPGVHEWTTWDESRFQENWQLIRSLRPVVRASGLSYRIDLSNEAIPTRAEPLVLEYSGRLWRNYTHAFGRSDTVGFSVIGDAAHVGQMRAVYGATPPRIFDIHFYGGTSGLSEGALFRSSDRAMRGQGLRQPWIIGEAFYDDQTAAEELRGAINLSGRSVYYLMQWPLTRGSACADVDVPAPTAFDRYVAAGFGFTPGRFSRPRPTLGTRKLRADRHGRVALIVGCSGTATPCTGHVVLHVGGRPTRAASFSMLPPETALRQVRLPARLRGRPVLRGTVTLTATSDDGAGTGRRSVPVVIRAAG